MLSKRTMIFVDAIPIGLAMATGAIMSWLSHPINPIVAGLILVVIGLTGSLWSERKESREGSERG